MKKMTLLLMTALLLLTFTPTHMRAATEPSTSIKTEPDLVKSNEEANALIARLSEIKSMDRSNLSSTEKKQLRKEVRATKSRLKELNGGIYLSAGAIIIIILLLILIL